MFTWSGATGEIRFGPRVFDREGRARQHGAVPPEDAQIYVTGYRYGGGRRGNVAANRLTVLHTSIPFVASVTNLDPATGGVDAETVENAKVRGPLYLRGGRRAVTAEDVERLTLDGAPAVARARCLPPAQPGEPARLLVVPRVDVAPEDLNLDDLIISPDLLEQIKAYLEPRRLLTMRIRVEPPRYQGVKVVAEVRAGAGVRPGDRARAGRVGAVRVPQPARRRAGRPGLAVRHRPAPRRRLRRAARRVRRAGRRGGAHLLGRPAPPGDPGPGRPAGPAAPEALFMSFQHRVVVQQ